MKLRTFTFLFLVLFSAGCSSFFGGSAPKPPLPAPSWKTVGGQVRYQDTHRSIIADVVLRIGPMPDQYSMEVTKAGASLLKMDRVGDLGWSRGLLGGRSFTGPVSRAPANLQSWFQATAAALKNTPPPAASPASKIQVQFRLGVSVATASSPSMVLAASAPRYSPVSFEAATPRALPTAETPSLR